MSTNSVRVVDLAFVARKVISRRRGDVLNRNYDFGMLSRCIDTAFHMGTC